MVYDGEVLPLTKVSRNEMGAYLCIATNGVPPSVSKRIILDVECKLVNYYFSTSFFVFLFFFYSVVTVFVFNKMLCILSNASNYIYFFFGETDGRQKKI